MSKVRKLAGPFERGDKNLKGANPTWADIRARRDGRAERVLVSANLKRRGGVVSKRFTGATKKSEPHRRWNLFFKRAER